VKKCLNNQTGSWINNHRYTLFRFVTCKSARSDGIVKQFVGKKFNENLFLDLQSKLYALNLFESFKT
jgi:hypothetical protein